MYRPEVCSPVWSFTSTPKDLDSSGCLTAVANDSDALLEGSKAQQPRTGMRRGQPKALR